MEYFRPPPWEWVYEGLCRECCSWFVPLKGAYPKASSSVGGTAPRTRGSPREPSVRSAESGVSRPAARGARRKSPRLEQHVDALKDRLGALGFVTRNVTREGSEEKNEAPTSMDLQAGEEVPEWARRRGPVHGRVNARPLAPEAELVDPPAPTEIDFERLTCLRRPLPPTSSRSFCDHHRDRVFWRSS